MSELDSKATPPELKIEEAVDHIVHHEGCCLEADSHSGSADYRVVMDVLWGQCLEYELEHETLAETGKIQWYLKCPNCGTRISIQEIE